MKYNELNLNKEKQAKRVGRGIAAGRGKTAGRGTKGQNSRKSGGVRPGFEGGQNPLVQRIPKLRGFRSVRPKTETVYTGQLNEFTSTVDSFKLHDKSLIKSPYSPVKVVVNGELTKKLTVSLTGASSEAQAMIKKAGGQFNAVDRAKRTKKEQKTT